MYTCVNTYPVKDTQGIRRLQISCSYSADKNIFLEHLHFQTREMLITGICELAAVLLKKSFNPVFAVSLFHEGTWQLALIV